MVGKKLWQLSRSDGNAPNHQLHLYCNGTLAQMSRKIHLTARMWIISQFHLNNHLQWWKFLKSEVTSIWVLSFSDCCPSEELTGWMLRTCFWRCYYESMLNKAGNILLWCQDTPNRVPTIQYEMMDTRCLSSGTPTQTIGNTKLHLLAHPSLFKQQP